MPLTAENVKGKSNLPPSNTKMEQSILAGMLLHPEDAAVAFECLTPSDFYSQTNAKIFQAAIDLHAKGEPVGLIELSDALKGVDGSATFLSGLIHDVPMTANMAHSCEKIRAYAVQREAIFEAERTAKRLYSVSPDDVKAELNNAVKNISEIAVKAGKGGELNPWDTAQKRFPLLDFPWEVMPEWVSGSLKQLARSHATSPLSLPGAAISILSSVVGATASISPKRSWKEPLIHWFADVRPSGAGKTGVARALCMPLYSAQTKADEEAKRLADEEMEKPAKDRRPTPKGRGYFITDLTLEGIRSDLSGHGGTVCILDEVSSFVSSQNQYKSKGGNDREAWLCLHDGQPARVVRAKESMTIQNSRVSIFGGIQPAVWQSIFSGKNDIFLSDGTIFRFLSTSEGERFYPLTSESWSDENRQTWESMLTNAMRFADSITANPEWKAQTILFAEEARNYFTSWRNEITSLMPELPEPIRGFIPKIVGYSVRLSGALYLLDRFSKGQAPGQVLDVSDVERGIKAASFYMGHTVNLMRGLFGNGVSGLVIDADVIRLAETLEMLRGDVDAGKLAIGHISAKFNSDAKRLSDKGVGQLVRRCGLTVKGGLHDANGKRRVSCMAWDTKTEIFIRTTSPKSPSLQKKENQDVRYGDIENAMSPKSPGYVNSGNKYGDMETFKNTSLHTQHIENKEIGDVGGLETLFPDGNEKEEVITI